jgi:hypothetical protein
MHTLGPSVVVCNCNPSTAGGGGGRTTIQVRPVR